MPSPQELAEEDRKRALARGDVLNQQAQERLGGATEASGVYGDYLNDLYGTEAQGGGGYRPEEAADIMGREGLEGLEMTPEEQAGAYLTPEEQAGVAGDPYARMDYFKPEQLTGMQQEAEQRQRGAAGGLREDLSGAVDPAKLGLREDYRAEGAETLNRGDTSIQQGIEGTEGRVRGAITREMLQQNPELAKDYLMSDTEKQDIITGAGISAGTGYRALSDQTDRAARAAGAGPMGVAAARGRNERAAAGEAGDAMTQARIKADAEQAGRAMDLERNRQQAEQYLASETAANEQQLGGRRLNAQNEALNRRLGYGESTEQMRLGAEQGIADRSMRAISEGGQAALGTERDIARQQQQVGQFNTETGMRGAGESEALAAQRAGDLAGNRQKTQQDLAYERYRRGAGRNEQISQRAGTVANERLRQQREARGYFGGRQEQANQNIGQEANRQLGIYGSQGSQIGQATGSAVQSAGQPKWWEKAANIAIGATKAAFPTGFARGGVITEPTMGTVAEEGPEYVAPVGRRGEGRMVTEPTTAMLGGEGPEAVIPMNDQPDNFTRPSVAYGREVIRKPKPRLPRLDYA